MDNPESNTGASARHPGQYPVIDSLCLELKHLLQSFGPPPEVRQHFRNARIEVLKGMRQMIDHRIDYLSREEQTGRKITVE